MFTHVILTIENNVKFVNWCYINYGIHVYPYNVEQTNVMLSKENHDCSC